MSVSCAEVDWGHFCFDVGDSDLEMSPAVVPPTSECLEPSVVSTSPLGLPADRIIEYRALLEVHRDKVTGMLAQLRMLCSCQDGHSHLVVRLLLKVARLPPHVLDLPSFYPLRLKCYYFRKVPTDAIGCLAAELSDGGAVKVAADPCGDCKHQYPLMSESVNICSCPLVVVYVGTLACVGSRSLLC